MSEVTRPGHEGATRTDVLYVSWGGTGRAATVREALTRAGGSGRGLTYLAILDDGAFGDIEPAMLELARHELSWLLDAQLDLTRRQTNLDDVPVRVVVRTGDVVDRIVEAAESGSVDEVLIGAPVSLTDAGPVTDLVARVGRRLDQPIEVIQPEQHRDESADLERDSGEAGRRHSGPTADHTPR